MVDAGLWRVEQISSYSEENSNPDFVFFSEKKNLDIDCLWKLLICRRIRKYLQRYTTQFKTILTTLFSYVLVNECKNTKLLKGWDYSRPEMTGNIHCTFCILRLKWPIMLLFFLFKVTRIIYAMTGEFDQLYTLYVNNTISILGYVNRVKKW